MMTGDREAFEREIVINPDDDLPRLIYADWLDDMGDPQGEFIRIQCERSRGNPSVELHRRELELIGKHRCEWIAQLGPGVHWYAFERGLVSDALISGNALLQNGGLLLSRAPLKSLGTSVKSVDQVRLLVEAPSLMHLRRLRLGDGQLGDEGMAALLASPYFPSLTELAVPRCELRRLGLRQLLMAPRLRDLKRLVISGNPLGNAGAKLIAGSPSMQNLEVLEMEECEVDGEGARALVDSPNLKKLRLVQLRFRGTDNRVRQMLHERFGPRSW